MTNSAFYNFVKENFSQDDADIRYLLNEMPPDQNYQPKFSIDDTHEDIFYYQKINDVISENKMKKLGKFKNQILILNKLLKSLLKLIHNETNGYDEVSGPFDLIALIKQYRLSKENDFFENKLTYKLVNNEKIYETYSRKSIFNNNEEVIDIMLNDVTSLIQLEITRADIKSRQVYLARIAHEFKTPINTLIYSINELIRNYKGKNSIDQNNSNDFEFIEGQANFISILIHDINDYCKNINEIEIYLDQFDLRKVLDFAFQILNTLINRNKYKKETVQTKLNICENVPKIIKTDERRLKQLLVNLLSNAVKYTNFGNISINVNFKPKSETGNEFDEIDFCVEDTGVGISKEEQKKLFKDFSNVNKQFIKLNKDGIGLGLAICKEIIRKLGKGLNCESENQLTRFFFTIYDKKDEINLLNETIIDEQTVVLVESSSFYIKSLSNFCISTENFFNEKEKNVNNNLLNNVYLEIQSKNELINQKRNTENIKNSKTKTEGIFKNKSNMIKIENQFLKMLESSEFIKHKANFFNFIKPPLKYLKFILEKINDLKIILIVDDERMNCRQLKRLVYKSLTNTNKKNNNYKVITLVDGIEALNLIYFDSMFFRRVSLIISDLNMKFMNGDLLFKFLRQPNINISKTLNFIMYSSEDIISLKSRVPEIKYFLRKPCSKLDLEKLFAEIGGF